MKLQKTKASVIVLVVLNASLAVAQTNPSKASPVGTWELDLKQSTFGSDPPPKSMTLTILEPDDSAWRIDAVDSEGKSQSFSWSGPVDGTLQPVKSADVDLIRFGGHLPKGGYDVQTDGRHAPAPAASALR